MTCKGAAGIVNEFTSMASDIKQQELLDGFIVGANLKGEHYEIATYRGLVEKANVMKHAEVARLLQENLRMEEEFAHKLEQLDRQLSNSLVQQKPELVGHKV
jgi:ferritin-like metal-binding protein YciE